MGRGVYPTGSHGYPKKNRLPSPPEARLGARRDIMAASDLQEPLMPKRLPVVPAAVCAVFLISAGLARAGEVELVSRRHPDFVAPQAPGTSGQPAVSADGRWIAFTSTSPNLLPQQSEANTFGDIFLEDRLSGTLSLLSHAAGFPATTGVSNSAYPSISADGRYVVFL